MSEKGSDGREGAHVDDEQIGQALEKLEAKMDEIIELLTEVLTAADEPPALAS